jgi:glycosyltransferase involved in cell wall biosynthesis
VDAIPVVSAIMPSYNSAQYLPEAIDSVLAQTFQDWELIVVDDASTDDTQAILARYTDPRIRLRRLHRNSGRSAARNVALGAARGRYIALCDSDDISLPHRFARQVEFLDAHPEIDIVSSRLRLISAASVPGAVIAFPEGPEMIAARFMRGRMGVPHGASMVRARCFERFGGYAEDLPRAEDFDLFHRFSEDCRFAIIPEILLQYRRQTAVPPFGIVIETTKCHHYALHRAAARRAGHAPIATLEEFSQRWSRMMFVYGWELVRLVPHMMRVYVSSNRH